MANTDPRTFAGLGSFLLRSLMEEGVVTRDISPERLKNILGTAAHETGFFERLEENLNYTSIPSLKKAGIDAINKLPIKQRRKLLNNPRAFANVAYRNLPGNTAPDDGYEYRGRGFVQLTGKANYKTMGDRLGIDLVKSPDLASDPKIAAQIYASWIKKSPVNGKGIENFDSFDSAYKAINPRETRKQREVRRNNINKYAGDGNIREWADSIFTRLDRTTPEMEIEEAETKSVKSALKQFYDPAFPKERPDDTERMLADEEKKSNPRIDNVVDRMRSAFKEKEVQETIKDLQSTKGLLKALGPSDGSTTSQIEKLARSKDFVKDVDKLPDRSVIKMFYQLGDMIKNFLTPETFKRGSSKISLISKAQASDKFNIDQLKTTNEKFQDLISRMAPAMDTSDIGVSGKPDTILSEEAGSPDMIGDTSNVDAPLVSYGGDKVGTAPELQTTDMDNLEATQNLFEPEKQMLVEGDPTTEDVKSPAGAKLLPNVASVNQDLAEGPEEDSISYALTDRFDDATEIGYGQLNKLDRNLEPRERSEFDVGFDDPMDVGGEADPRDERDDVIGDPIDFGFLKSLFTTGVGTGRDSESEVNIGADYFFDEPMPMGGEADPRDEDDDVVMNFEEGGEVKADFDGKDDEDEDEGDPPPLAKPEEVADDIPALLSEGEYVLPANVVRYIGLERIMDMHRQVLSEIQQMEDLGMIQNVDKNGEPEDDDDEMKFAEGEEGVTKGTIIIASAKPKGMMCPEPLRFAPGGTGTNDNDNDTGAGDVEDPDTPPDAGQDDETDEEGVDPDITDFGGFAGPGELGFEGREKDKDGLTDTERGGMPSNEREALGLDKNATELDIAFEKSKKGPLERAMYAAGKFGERMGIDVTEKAAAAREAAEKDMGQPGDSDFEIKEENIKQDKVDDVISDLITKNVYIEGVGYVPLASLMSPRNDVTV
tara:strand:- start:902 stop:3718 length:2817 start_codon:yes stop_codon:yes gene_type:complete